MALYAFISDLHLGDGGPREDFYWHDGAGDPARPVPPAARRRGIERLHARFGGLTDWLLAEGARRGEQPHLIMLGDWLDLLQAPAGLAAPRERADAIIAVHAPAFAHLRHFGESGGALSYVIGNHDHEMFDEEAWAALRRAVPAINASATGAPAGLFAAPEAGIAAEHGHQFDPINAFARFGDPSQTTIGAEIVRHIVNPWEDRFPLLDNLPGSRAALWFALRHLPALLGEAMRLEWRDAVRLMRESGGAPLPLGEIVQHLAHLLLLHYAGASSRELMLAVARLLLENEELLRAALAGARPPRGLLASLGSVGRHPIRVLMQSVENDVRRGAMEKYFGLNTDGSGADRKSVNVGGAVLSGDHGSESASKVNLPAADPSPPIRIILCGHTHQAGIWPAGNHSRNSGKLRYLMGKDGDEAGSGWYVNTGTWRPVARPWGRSGFRIEQPLNVALVARDRRGFWRPRLLNWADRSQ